MRIQNRRKIASVLFVLISFVCAAQDAPEPPPATSPPGTPIDGWVLIVLLIGLIYGVYKSFKLVKQ
ncbi:MAG: hypothetical protein KC469_09950 [Flavobacteriaceae bacterium]|nr:hypothetical protein [Flavobacteriaceae bacterium]